MSRILEVADIDRCEELWRATMPADRITDLWELRSCFHRHFRRPAAFFVVEDGPSPQGLLPLSWIEETGSFGFFPGETWRGRTWLENNRVPSADGGVLAELLRCCPAGAELRYMVPLEAAPEWGMEVDEIGYHFVPEAYDFSLDNYFESFSHKHAKRLRREIEAIERQGLRFRLDDAADFDELVALNSSRFGSSSYFHCPRFRNGFRDVARLLEDRGWLRMTTVLHGNRLVAVDIGSLYGGVYTMLAGGTNPDYPGIAKVINLHHMRRACDERIGSVDFLCGDFSWKKLFHLEPRPLYLYRSEPTSLAVGRGEGSHAYHVS